MFYATMSVMIYAALIILGLVLGSFCNATIWRLHAQLLPSKNTRKVKEDLSIVTGRSHCFYCDHELAPIDLIPVVSYLVLRGKCRYCRHPIDDTPTAELLLPLLFVISYRWWPYDLTASGLTLSRLIFGLWLGCLVAFVILALYDLRWYLLPDRVVAPLVAAAALVLLGRLLISHDAQTLVDALLALACTAGLFYLFYIVSGGRWIGFGDVKLAIALGLLVGAPLPALLLLFIASLTGSIAAIPALLRGRPVKGMRLPFGPFLLLATVVVVLFGAQLVNWYTSLFFT